MQGSQNLREGWVDKKLANSMRIYNSLSRKIEEFTPLNPPGVGMYTCGPTVYDYTHIGHLRKYVGDDILKRILRINDFDVKHVMNITDVGHLVSDADWGDDKLEKGAKERGQTVWEVAKFFEDYFFKSTDAVNILRPNIVARATEHIGEQIKLAKLLEEKGFIYQTEEAIYFDISKFPEYTKLSGQKLEGKLVGAREDVVVDPKKRNPYDFALWFFLVGRFSNHTMRWPSPWGEGFPGWHLECSAMSMEYLGNSFDIHTGGVDHIPVHHTNEIAQSEAVTSHLFVKYWVHHEWLLVDGEKMSKSKKNFYKVEDLKEKGFDPLALRYLFLTAHYRDKLNFTWKSLEAAQNALNNLREEIRRWEQPKGDVGQFWQRFLEAANNDLNMPQAVAVVWDMIRSDTPTSSKTKDLLEMDKVLGLGLDKYLGEVRKVELPKSGVTIPIYIAPTTPMSNATITRLDMRELARRQGDYHRSDEIRTEIEKKDNLIVQDTGAGTVVKEKL